MNKKPPLTIEEIARTLNGELLLAEGEAENRMIEGVSTLDQANEKCVSFLTSSKFEDALNASRAAVVLIPQDFDAGGRSAIRLDNVWRGVKWLLEYFYKFESEEESIDPQASVAADVTYGKNLVVGANAVIEAGVILGDNVRIGAGSFIGENSRLGDGTAIHPNVTIYHETQIGNNCIVHSGTVIGADGYKYEKIDGLPQKIMQVGCVVLEDEVEIGANTCIDRASFNETRIGRGTKIDNLVQIAHNVKLGRYCLIVAGAGIAGSTELGDGCIVAGQAGLKDNINLGNGVIIGAQAGVMNDIPDGEMWVGSPAQPRRDFFKQELACRKFPELSKDLKKIKKSLKID